MMKRGYIAACALSALLVMGGCGSSSKPAETVDAATQEETATVEETAADEPAQQIFDSDVATAEFKGLQDVDPYIYVPFMLTNKTGVAVDVRPDHVVVNGQVNVVANGGSSLLAPIDPGNSGAVTATIALEFAGLSSIDEVSSISGDLVLYDHASTFSTIVGSVHFDVTV